MDPTPSGSQNLPKVQKPVLGSTEKEEIRRQKRRAYYLRNKHRWAERQAIQKIQDPEKYRAYHLAAVRRYKKRHPEKDREYWLKNRTKLSEQRKRYAAANPTKVSQQQKIYRARWKTRNLRYAQIHRDRLRKAVFDTYGRVCKCCGETTEQFLSIDHVNGGGAAHRRKIGSQLYRWLKKHDFPPGFQVLCHNCNQAKGFYGVCPHQAQPSQSVANYVLESPQLKLFFL